MMELKNCFFFFNETTKGYLFIYFSWNKDLNGVLDQEIEYCVFFPIYECLIDF